MKPTKLLQNLEIIDILETQIVELERQKVIRNNNAESNKFAYYPKKTIRDIKSQFKKPVIIGVWIFAVLLFVILDRLPNITGIHRSLGYMWFVLLSPLIPLLIFFYISTYKKTKVMNVENAEIDSYNAEVDADNIEKYKIETQPEIDNINAEISELQSQIQEIKLDWYPPNYDFKDARVFFIDAIRNGKADTIKEAVNLYDVHAHRAEQISLERARLDAQQKAIDLQEEILDEQIEARLEHEQQHHNRY